MELSMKKSKLAFIALAAVVGSNLAVAYDGESREPSAQSIAPQPIVRIDPMYPMDAARKGLEGYVTLTFSISRIGAVEDVVVVESSPQGVFDKAAKKALLRWRYTPKVIDGQMVKRANQTTRLDFKL